MFERESKEVVAKGTLNPKKMYLRLNRGKQKDMHGVGNRAKRCSETTESLLKRREQDTPRPKRKTEKKKKQYGRMLKRVRKAHC